MAQGEMPKTDIRGNTLTRDEPLSPIGNHTIISNLATVSILSQITTSQLILQVFLQNVRLRLDGTNPTSLTGFRLFPGTIYIFNLEANVEARLIEESAGATAQYQWTTG